MKKNKILAAILSLVLVACTFSACGDAKVPGEKNDKITDESPDRIELIDEGDKKAGDVTAITGATAPGGKVVDSTGILDADGHRIYSTGQKDAAGQLIYTTGKYASNGKIIYTKNQVDSFGNIIYYTGEYNSDGKLILTPTQEVPNYATNDKPSSPNTSTSFSRHSTVGAENKSDVSITDAKSTFTKYFGGSSADTFKAVTPCDDGGIAAVCSTQSKDGDLSGSEKSWSLFTAIVKYAEDGSLKWKYIIGGNSMVMLDGITELKDGSIVAVGQTLASDLDAPLNSKSLSALIVRLDKNGKLMWMYTFPGSKDQEGEYASCVAAAPDGGFVVGGKATTNAGFFKSDVTGKNSKAFLIKFDKNCNVKWRKILTATMSNNFTAVDINDNGDIFAACVTTSTDGDFSAITLSSPATKNTVLMKFNKNGDLQWSDYLIGSGNSEFNAVKATSDGGCIVGGSYTIFKKADGIYSMSYGKSDGYVIRYNGKGEVCWARVIGGSGADYVNGITEVKGGYAVVGQTSSSDYDFRGLKNGGNGDAFLIYLNEKGETSARLLLVGDKPEAIMDVCTLKDGAIAVSGWTQSSDTDFKNSGAASQAKAFVSKFTAVTK